MYSLTLENTGTSKEFEKSYLMHEYLGYLLLLKVSNFNKKLICTHDKGYIQKTFHKKDLFSSLIILVCVVPECGFVTVSSVSNKARIAY